MGSIGLNSKLSTFIFLLMCQVHMWTPLSPRILSLPLSWRCSGAPAIGHQLFFMEGTLDMEKPVVNLKEYGSAKSIEDCIHYCKFCFCLCMQWTSIGWKTGSFQHEVVPQLIVPLTDHSLQFFRGRFILATSKSCNDGVPWGCRVILDVMHDFSHCYPK